MEPPTSLASPHSGLMKQPTKEGSVSEIPEGRNGSPRGNGPTQGSLIVSRSCQQAALGRVRHMCKLPQPVLLRPSLLATRFVQEDRLLAFVQCANFAPDCHDSGLSGQHAGASDAHRHLEEDADRKHLRRPAAGGLSWLPGVAHAFST